MEQGPLPALLRRGVSPTIQVCGLLQIPFFFTQHRCEYSASSILSAPILVGAAYHGSAGFTQS